MCMRLTDLNHFLSLFFYTLPIIHLCVIAKNCCSHQTCLSLALSLFCETSCLLSLKWDACMCTFPSLLYHINVKVCRAHFTDTLHVMCERSNIFYASIHTMKINYSMSYQGDAMFNFLSLFFLFFSFLSRIVLSFNAWDSLSRSLFSRIDITRCPCSCNVALADIYISIYVYVCALLRVSFCRLSFHFCSFTFFPLSSLSSLYSNGLE